MSQDIAGGELFGFHQINLNNMEKNQISDSKNIPKKRFSLWRWSPGFLITAYLLLMGQKLAKTTADEFVFAIVAVTAGILYSKITKRITFIKNNILKGIVVAVGLLVVSAFLAGVLTRIF